MHNLKTLALVMLLSVSHIKMASAERLSNLVASGWSIALKETVSDTFNGCDYDTPVPIDRGYIFICSEYSYHYAYRPEFLVLVRGSQTKYVIDGEVFDGELYKGYPTITYVTGDFEGCDYDKIITFDNGLIFQCDEYHYHYAYHPKVMIVGKYVTIAGKKYRGTLYRP